MSRREGDQEKDTCSQEMDSTNGFNNYLCSRHLQQQQLQHLQRLQQMQPTPTAQLPGPPAQALQPPPPQAQAQPPLFGHDPAVEIPEEGFLLGCVFAIADYPEQMSDKQLLATWKRIIQAHGGAVDPTFSSRCTHLLCESQVSGLFAQAMKERKRCITAHWLNTVLKKKKLVPPHRALHFPVAFPPGGKPCSQHIISVTGFVDNDRDDLKLMAYLAGAKYTGYLCRSNTVLICREPTGLKYEKAKEWRIPCVNAQWLGDILLGNFEALRQTQYGRYTAFGLQDPFAPTPQLVLNLLDAWRVPLKVSSELLMGVRLPPKPKQNEVTNVQPSPLFKAKYFYITPGICPSLSTMKAIVECAGGKVLSRQPSFRKLMEHKQNKSLSEIVLISCENDLHLCREYFARGIDVHNAEFVLTGVLTQTLDYESYKFN